jgi:DNA-binding CsgD family transcriptional regulator
MIMSNRHYEQNPSLKHAALLQSVCRPLDKHGVSFFGYTAVDAMNRAYCLGSKADYAENYLRSALAHNDIHRFEMESKTKPQYFFWDFCELDKENEILYDIAAKFNQSHTLTITRSSKDLIECYHFSGKNHDEHLNQYYAENLDALHLYIDYFDDCLKNIPELAELYKHPVSISKTSLSVSNRPQECAEIRPDIHNIAQFTTPITLTRANQFLLSDQERECLRWMHKGKPYEMIGQIMNVSRKTVERYVTTIKEKYECTTLFQLGEKMAEHNLTPLLSQYQSR